LNALTHISRLQVRLWNIQVKFVCQGHWIKVKVAGAKTCNDNDDVFDDNDDDDDSQIVRQRTLAATAALTLA